MILGSTAWINTKADTIIQRPSECFKLWSYMSSTTFKPPPAPNQFAENKTPAFCFLISLKKDGVKPVCCLNWVERWATLLKLSLKAISEHVTGDIPNTLSIEKQLIH